MFRSLKSIIAAGVVAAGLAMTGSARADIVPTLNSVSVGPVISGTQYYTWSYNLSLSAAENLETNNFFTIYDTVGLLSGSEVGPANWTGGDQLTGVNAPGAFPVTGDSASVLNVGFNYIGSDTVVGAVSSLGTFTFLSSDNVVATGSFTSEAVNNSGPNAGSVDGNSGSVSVPAPSVPMPAALPIGLALLAGIGVTRKLVLA